MSISMLITSRPWKDYIMRNLIVATLVIGWLAGSAARSEIPEEFTLDEARAIATASIDLIEEVYVLEDPAHEIAAELRARLGDGAFDFTDPVTFSQKFNTAMRDISGDLHMSFRPDPEQYEVLLTGDAEAEEPSGEQIEYYLTQARRANFGFSEVRFLPGNIGYLNITGFWGGGEDAEDKTRAAMEFLHGSDAILIDVRGNGGGDAEAVRLVQSFFFDKPTHVLTFHNRFRGIVEESMTPAPPTKHHLGDVPLYVLTSGGTGSAAEDFSYIMKAHDKATLVGATTAGAGHTVGFFPVDPGFVIGISDGRPESPVTGEGWEGVGVVPDIDVAAPEALHRAQMEALNLLKANAAADGADPFTYDWALTGLEGEASPPQLTSRELKAMAGTFGPREISRKGSKLYYARSGGTKAELVPLTKTIFQHSLNPGFRIRFIWEGKKVVAIEGLYQTGRVDLNNRD